MYKPTNRLLWAEPPHIRPNEKEELHIKQEELNRPHKKNTKSKGIKSSQSHMKIRN